MTALANKVAIVTGASSGIGYASAFTTASALLVDGGVSINRI